MATSLLLRGPSLEKPQTIWDEDDSNGKAIAFLSGEILAHVLAHLIPPAVKSREFLLKFTKLPCFFFPVSALGGSLRVRKKLFRILYFSLAF